MNSTPSPKKHSPMEVEIDYFMSEYPELTREEIIDILEIYVIYNDEAS